jgi:signal transduction histidine kinase
MEAPAQICIFRGPHHIYDFVNPAAQEAIGEAVLDRPAREAVADADPAQMEILARVFQTGEPYVGTEVPIVVDRHGRPSQRFFNLAFEPYRDGAGTVEGVMSFGFDVTDQVEARRKAESLVHELEVANRTKDEFLATVSHELRTPLNAILGWVRMVRDDTLPDDKKTRALEIIERNAKAQAQLIEDLLDVSRITSGKLRLDVGTIDLPNVVENAIEAVRPAANAKGVGLRSIMDAQAGRVLGDPNRLQQVIWNLLTNAVKFTPRGGDVRVEVRKDESAVEVAVSDTGQGIATEFLPYVFERFRQADATTTRKHGGLGLGLAIVRHLVELHGGTVKVESDGPGTGTTFTVRIPWRRSEQPRPDSASSI